MKRENPPHRITRLFKKRFSYLNFLFLLFNLNFARLTPNAVLRYWETQYAHFLGKTSQEPVKFSRSLSIAPIVLVISPCIHSNEFDDYGKESVVAKVRKQNKNQSILRVRYNSNNNKFIANLLNAARTARDTKKESAD